MCLVLSVNEWKRPAISCHEGELIRWNGEESTSSRFDVFALRCTILQRRQPEQISKSRTSNQTVQFRVTSSGQDILTCCNKRIPNFYKSILFPQVGLFSRLKDRDTSRGGQTASNPSSRYRAPQLSFNPPQETDTQPDSSTHSSPPP